MKVVGALVVVALVVPACSDSPDVEVGWHGTFGGGPSPEIDVPATATAGTPFTVSFYTGGSGCGSAVSTEVTSTPDGALVIPYDHYDEPCKIQIAAVYQHSAELTFATPGTYAVRLRFRGCYKLPDCAAPLYDNAFSVAVH